MAEHDPIRTRWVDGETDDAMARLMRHAQPQLLTPRALRRVRTRLSASLQAAQSAPIPSPWRRPVFIAAFSMILGVAMGVGISELWMRSRPPGDSAARLDEIAASMQAPPSPPVTVADSPRLVFLGPGEAVVANAGATPRLIEGTLLIKTEGTLAVISAPHCEVRVALHSITEIAVHGSEVVVGTHAGQAVIEWPHERRIVTVAMGKAATKNAVYELPKTRWQEIAPFLNGQGAEARPASLPPLVAPPRLVSQLPPLEKPAVSRAVPPMHPVQKDRPVPMPSAAPIPETKSPSASPPSSEISTLSESQLLNEALASWRKQKDPAAALRLLEDYNTRFPQGVLHPEADFLQVRLFLALQKPQEALAVLDKNPLKDETPRSLELRIVRGELRQSAGRCVEAIADFSEALPKTEGVLHERASYGRYRCYVQTGDRVRARGDREYYLRRFPQGRFVEELRRDAPPTSQ